MKKFFSYLLVTLLAVTSFALVSCSNDDGPTPNGGDKIKINGVSYNLSAFQKMGSWNEFHNNEGEFTVSVNNKIDGAIIVDYYSFSFTSTTVPQVGDDFAKKTLALTPLIEEEEGNIIELEKSFRYSSGKAVVIGVNPSESEITIKFENLKMSNGNRAYTFNGTVTLLFDF